MGWHTFALSPWLIVYLFVMVDSLGSLWWMEASVHFVCLINSSMLYVISRSVYGFMDGCCSLLSVQIIFIIPDLSKNWQVMLEVDVYVLYICFNIRIFANFFTASDCMSSCLLLILHPPLFFCSGERVWSWAVKLQLKRLL